MTDNQSTQTTAQILDEYSKASEQEKAAMLEIQKKKLKTFLFWHKQQQSNMHLLGFAKNQRKTRKNRRRAFAAGNRQAFNK